MSVKNAMLFIEKVGKDDALKARIRAGGRDMSLDQVVDIGRDIGLEFTVEELRTAFVRDWNLRYTFYTSGISRL